MNGDSSVPRAMVKKNIVIDFLNTVKQKAKTKVNGILGPMKTVSDV